MRKKNVTKETTHQKTSNIIISALINTLSINIDYRTILTVFFKIILWHLNLK